MHKEWAYSGGLVPLVLQVGFVDSAANPTSVEEEGYTYSQFSNSSPSEYRSSFEEEES